MSKPTALNLAHDRHSKDCPQIQGDQERPLLSPMCCTMESSPPKVCMFLLPLLYFPPLPSVPRISSDSIPTCPPHASCSTKAPRAPFPSLPVTLLCTLWHLDLYFGIGVVGKQTLQQTKRALRSCCCCVTSDKDLNFPVPHS